MTSTVEQRAGGIEVRSGAAWEIAFVATSCVLLHFMVAMPLGYPLTIAPVAVCFVLGRHYDGKMSLSALIGMTALLLLPFVNVLGQPAERLVRFVRTDALWVFNVTAIWWAARGDLSSRRTGIVQGAFTANVIIACYSAAQAALAFFVGSNALFNPFRGHQYLHEYDAALHDAGVGAWSRAPSFYLEPSFGAFVMVSLCVVCLLAHYRPTASILVVSAGLFFNRSFTGIIAFAILAAIHLGMSLGRRVPRAIQLGAAMFVTAIAALGLRQLLATRIGELGVEGASAYYRIISPLIVLRDVLQFKPLGVEFGQVEAFLMPYGLLQTGAEGNTLDNGLYVVVFYFGWVGLAAIVALVANAVKQLVLGNRDRAILWTMIFFSMAFSGAVFVPEFAFLIILVVYQFRAGPVPRFERTSYAPARALVPM
jgi:putative colanic acid polymerase